MATGDLINVWVLKHMYIPKEINKEFAIISVDHNQKGQIIGNLRGELVTIQSNGQTISSFAHTKGITLGAAKNQFYLLSLTPTIIQVATF